MTNALERVGRKANSGTLNVSLVTTFALGWLAPRLHRFQAKHPEIEVRMTTTQRRVDFAREEVDVGLRGGSGRWPGLVAHPLLPWHFAPYASPDLLARLDLATPADLLSAPLISPDDPWWRHWFAAAGVDAGDIAARPAVLMGMQQLQGAAALSGQGIALLTPSLWPDDIAAGRLVAPFDIVGREGEGSIWLVYPESKRGSRKVRAFRDWILAAIRP